MYINVSYMNTCMYIHVFIYEMHGCLFLSFYWVDL